MLDPTIPEACKNARLLKRICDVMGIEDDGSATHFGPASGVELERFLPTEPHQEHFYDHDQDTHLTIFDRGYEL